MSVLIAGLGNQVSGGGIITSNVSTKFKVKGIFVAFEGSVVTFPSAPPDVLATQLSARLMVEGKHAACIGTLTLEQQETVVGGIPGFLVGGGFYP